MNRVATEGFVKFVLAHERQIAEDDGEWRLLYHAFWQVIGRQPGVKMPKRREVRNDDGKD